MEHQIYYQFYFRRSLLMTTIYYSSNRSINHHLNLQDILFLAFKIDYTLLHAHKNHKINNNYSCNMQQYQVTEFLIYNRSC